jgi:uncharacterized membrane protein YqjE
MQLDKMSKLDYFFVRLSLVGALVMLAMTIWPNSLTRVAAAVTIALIVGTIGVSLFVKARETPFREVRVWNLAAGVVYIGLGLLAFWGAWLFR